MSDAREPAPDDEPSPAAGSPWPPPAAGSAGPPPAAEEVGTVIDVDPEDGTAPVPPGGAGPTGAEPADVGPSDADLTGEALADALRQRDDYLGALQHLQADFENFKKRVAKQQADTTTRAAESLVDKLLPVLDVADLALAHGAGPEVKQVWSALLDVLEREGLERIDPAGGAFDPNRHDAVAVEPGDGTDQEVAEVLRAGYAWKGRVLRPAMVKVRG